jgi:hypothetical protein
VVSILEQYVPQNAFSVDETALFYNDRPNRALKIKGKKHAREESSTKTD